MGSITNTSLPGWKDSPAIQRLLESHMFKEAEVIEVSLMVHKKDPETRVKKYAVVIYKLGEKLFRAELKLRDDRHWGTRRENDEKERRETRGSHFTASDLLGQKGVSGTEENNRRL